MEGRKESKKPIGPIRRFTELVVAGHGDIYCDYQNRTILKQLQPSPRGDRETEFYQELRAGRNQTTRTLEPLCPQYYGLVESADANRGYLRLEDLTRPFEKPCIIDIKIGSTYHKFTDPDASEAKRKREEANYPLLRKLGFQLVGCRIDGETRVKLDKKWGRGLHHEQQLVSGLDRFLSGGGSAERISCIRESIISRLESIREWFLTQTTYHFYASSILILYEGATMDNGRKPARVDVRMIDFAHVHGAKERGSS